MRVADTSILYAALDGADPRQSEARKKLGAGRPVLVPLATWAEFLRLVEHRMGRAKALEVASAFGDTPGFSIQHAGNPPAADAIWRAHPKLSLVDAIGIQACLETGADLLSFDDAQIAAMPMR